MEKKIYSEMEKEQHKSECKAHYDAADSNDKLVINLRDINRTMRFLYEGRESQKRILMILLESAPITQRSLTERLGIQPGSASEVLAKLEKGGLIARTESPDDRRTTDITLTHQGQLLADEAFKQRKVRHEEMFSCLTEDEKSGLLALLEKVNADWKERYQSIGEHSCCRHGRGHGHEHGGDYEHDPGQDHERGHGRDHGHEHGRDQEHGHGRDHGHEHGRDQEHGHGRDHGHEHGREHRHGNEHDREHGNERSGCDGNCQECKHPCKRGIERKKIQDGHDSESHHS